MCGEETGLEFPVDIPENTSPQSLPGDGNGMANNINSAKVDQIIADNQPKRDFEITVRYGWTLLLPQPQDYIVSGKIGSGQVLIGEQVITTKPVYFSGDVDVWLRAYKLEDSITHDVRWRVYVDTYPVKRDFGKNIHILLKYERPLVTIKDGYLEKDYRYLPQMSVAKKVLPGNVTYTHWSSDPDSPGSLVTDCWCPSIYDTLHKQKSYLEFLKKQLDDYLEQTGIILPVQ